MAGDLLIRILVEDSHLSLCCVKNNNENVCVGVVVKCKNGLFYGMCFIFSLLVSLI